VLVILGENYGDKLAHAGGAPSVYPPGARRFRASL
jgi:hypothetical protein